MADIYPDQQKLKATNEDKSILENNDISAQIIRHENANSEERRKKYQLLRSRPEQYIE